MKTLKTTRKADLEGKHFLFFIFLLFGIKDKFWLILDFIKSSGLKL